MEWVLVLIGIAYSIWSTYRKEAKENEQKRQQGNPQIARQRPVTSREAADHVFSHRSGRRTLGDTDPNIVREANQVREVSAVREVGAIREVGIDEMQEDFASRLNRTILSRDVESDIRRTLAEVFGDTNTLETLRPETERYKDYDKLSTYDDRIKSSYTHEHNYGSHFKLNEGLRKDSFRVGSESGFDDADDAYEKKSEPRKLITLDKGSLKSYYIMHEILSKPKALEALERRHHIARRDARHPS